MDPVVVPRPDNGTSVSGLPVSRGDFCQKSPRLTGTKGDHETSYERTRMDTIPEKNT